MENQVVVNKLKEVEAQVGSALDSLLLLMKFRAEKILEGHQEFMPAELYEDFRKDQDQRYTEIKDWLAKEYFLRFNDELFLGSLDSVPVIPTKINSHVDKDVISDNRESFSKYFFEGRMSE